MSHSLLSLVVRGVRAPSERLIDLFSALPGVNRKWLTEGIGEPLLAGERGTLPVSVHLLPGPPSSFAQFLSGSHHPVAASAECISRYWYQLPSTSPLLMEPQLCMRSGDHLLIETDRDYLSRLDILAGQLVAVRQSPSEVGCGLAKKFGEANLWVQLFRSPYADAPSEDSARTTARQLMPDPGPRMIRKRTLVDDATSVPDTPEIPKQRLGTKIEQRPTHLASTKSVRRPSPESAVVGPAEATRSQPPLAIEQAGSGLVSVHRDNIVGVALSLSRPSLVF